MRVSRRARVLAALAALGFLSMIVGCETPTDTAREVLGVRASMAITDAAYDASSGLYFLPPMVDSPQSFAGTFDPTLSPVVRICHWVADACTGSEIVFDASGNGAQRVHLDVEEQSYGALWKDTHGLAVGDVYRLHVFADASATVPLGYADLLVVGQKHGKSAASEYIGVAQGLPFHIKFRIEEGAGVETVPDLDGVPAVAVTAPFAGATGVAPNATIEVTFDEPVNFTGDWFQVTCDVSGTRTPSATTVSGGPYSFTIDPYADFVLGESCAVTIVAAQVADQDANDPPDAMTTDHVFQFTIAKPFGPALVNDGPAANSTPGTPYHTFLDFPLYVLAYEGLLTNDVLGVPAGQLVSFGGGSLGGTVTEFAAGTTVKFGLDGDSRCAEQRCELTVLANGALAFRPPLGFTGAFTFHYRVMNAVGTGDATVTIYVGERPSTGS